LVLKVEVLAIMEKNWTFSLKLNPVTEINEESLLAKRKILLGKGLIDYSDQD
jgi:hypothetical protein